MLPSPSFVGRNTLPSIAAEDASIRVCTRSTGTVSIIQILPMRSDRMTYRLVDTIPENLEPSVVYVSHKYGVATHLCACGCGYEAFVELGPGKWRVDLRAGRITMSPSIGNSS